MILQVQVMGERKRLDQTRSQLREIESEATSMHEQLQNEDSNQDYMLKMKKLLHEARASAASPHALFGTVSDDFWL